MLSISKLTKEHDRAGFDCGNQALNHFISHLASQMIKRHETVIYVAHDQTKAVVGYYTLSAMQIDAQDDPKLLAKQSKHLPIPCVLLGRLAVDKSYQGRGIGRDLLLHALRNVKVLSQSLGLAFVVVDAKDETAKAFYQVYGFVELSRVPHRLCLPVASLPTP